MQSLLKMLSFSNAPTVAIAEDDVAAEADEPPDDRLSALHQISKNSQYPKASRMPPGTRRESLLTRAIMSDSQPEDLIITANPNVSRGLSTASSHSATSMASTAELTSDASPTRSCTPSPPLPAAFAQLPLSKVPVTQVSAVPAKSPTQEGGEAAIEKTLGRKRCIMFACGKTTPEPKEEKPVEEPKPEPPKRKCALTFVCPSRQEPVKEIVSKVLPKQRQPRVGSPVAKRTVPSPSKLAVGTAKPTQPTTPVSPQTFHEFGSSHDETDSWVNTTLEHKNKLTLSDCMKKEMAIRKLGEEAEEEAEEEEREADEDDVEDEDEQGQDDDFAPSDDGNESDDEGGFADSDDESDAGSDYQFWAPTALSTTTAATSTENLSHISTRGRSRNSSLDSLVQSDHMMRSTDRLIFSKRAAKMNRMRPSTPELPDSTDFVCGTLDEDRPLEAAYKSCIEQRKRQKHVPIPQDIDPSFPTSDPEDEEDDEEDEAESPDAGAHMWMQDQFADFDVAARSKTPTAAIKSATPPSPRNEFPFPRPQMSRRPTKTKSPPPPTRRARSPPPKHLLFRRGEDSPPRRMRSPAPTRLRSPPASPNNAIGFGPRIDLAQRPLAHRGRRERTASLPRTPNPFFKHFNVGSPSISNVASGAVTPAVDETPRTDMHVRGPVDIVMGLERKRQKRKEKFWRAHCRKAAKEHAEKRTIPGRGAERMRELGLECAERTRGYGLPGQGTKLVLSL